MTRLWGIAIVIAAFIVMIVELRYLIAAGTPSATGSIRGNLGLLMLLGIPWAILVAGALQALSGLTFNRHAAAFLDQPLARRITLSVAVLIFSFAMTGLAVIIA